MIQLACFHGGLVAFGISTHQFNRTDYSTLLPYFPFHLDMISNKCFFACQHRPEGIGEEYNGQQRWSGLEHHPWDFYGLSTMFEITQEIYINLKYWLWLLFGKYKLSNSLWIWNLWSSWMWHHVLWQTGTGFRRTYCLHLQGNICTHLPKHAVSNLVRP